MALIKIAFVIPTLDQSGAERQLALLAAGLPRSEYEVRVIALDRGGAYAEVLRKAGVQVDILSKRFRLDPLALFRLRSVLHEFRPDIVQCFLFAANSYVRFPGVVPRKTRIVVSERCVDSWKGQWQLTLDRWLAGRTDALTVNSESVGDFYRQVGVPANLMVVIPNAVVPQPLLYSREEARERLGIDPSHRVVGFIGRLAPQKRLRDLIWSFQLLHQIVENARLVLIGDGPDRYDLERLTENFGCRSKVIFAGHRADAAALVKALDVFVLPSEFEGMSNSLMEAMSEAIPCVASDIPANRELVAHGQTGWTFPLGDCPALTRQLVQVLSDLDTAGKVGKNASTKIRESHDLQTMIDRHRALYDRLLE